MTFSAPSSSLLVVGSANLDFVMGLPRLPLAGETVDGGVFRQAFGGKGANQAVAAARAGAATVFLASLGNDALSDEMVAAWAGDGIDVSRVLRQRELPTGSALILVDPDGRNCIGIAPGANGALTPEVLAGHADAFAIAGAVLVQAEIPAESLRAIRRLAAEHGCPVLFNYAPVAEPLVDLIDGVHCLFVNETEAASLTGIVPGSPYHDRAAVEKLQALGAERVILTLGERGCLAVELGREMQAFAARPATVVDTTAAGDTFCGAFAAAQLRGATFADCVEFAIAAATISVSRPGAQPSIPTESEINETLSPRHSDLKTFRP